MSSLVDIVDVYVGHYRADTVARWLHLSVFVEPAHEAKHRSRVP